ncbi:hypothetical protein HY029_05475 [Candidatus Gottesmanbacteria bacterium]|nr:hypothetical protein [Candidatus Gottesmanbacteria bacterium]
MNIKVGKVTHYYDHIGVAVVAVVKTIKVGDRIKISGHDKEFTQEVDSLQMDLKPIKRAKSKTSVGLKVTQSVKENDEVYKVG